MVESRILVTGSSGQVGTAMQQIIPAAQFVERRDLDLADITSIDPYLRSAAPLAVINCAAYTAVDAAEADERAATIINGDAVGSMARTCSMLGIPFVTYSTDYVFDGSQAVPYVESDPTCPINAYGRSKLRGEVLALEHPTSLVVRTSWVISGTHDNFVSAILRRASAGSVTVVNDQVGRPTVAADLAAATVTALEAGLKGLVHMANEDETTWFGLASALIDAAGYRDVIVEPCATSEFATAAERPAHSVLDTERSDCPTLPSWRDAIDRIVAQQMSRLG